MDFIARVRSVKQTTIVCRL